ncbi:MAG: MerR family transcriptional regulator [Leptolyngbyaceae cyanobacterium]
MAMSILQQIAQANPEWDLEGFVQKVNALLPAYLPEDGDRATDGVNPRLVRSYTTQGVVDRPQRQGREARYHYRHLLQVLLVRRLLNEGYGTAAIQPITSAKATPELEALLQGGLQLTVETANPALAFLQSVQARGSQASPPPAAPMPSPAPRAAPQARSKAVPRAASKAAQPVRWQRVEVLPGLEIQVREDFIPPSTPQEHENLLQLIAQTLTPLLSRRSDP